MTYHDRFRPLLAPLVLALLVPAAGFPQRSGSTIASERIFEAVGLREGKTVCEIGAGDGELSIEAARRVGLTGHVYTSELGDSRVKALKEKVAEAGLSQITVIAGDSVTTNFPAAACDAVFMRNVYHHFEDPAAMDASIATSLKPGGRLAIVDFTPRGKEATCPADRDNDGTHGVSPESVSRELRQAGFDPVSSDTARDRWFMVVVAKPTGSGL